MGPFNLFTVNGQYNVIETDYSSFALIYSCKDYLFFNVEYAWILSRTRTLDNDKLQNLIEKFKIYTNVNNFLTTDQSNCA